MKFNETDQVAQKYNIGKNDEWLTFEPGDNKIRIVSEYEAFGKHWTGNKAIICVGHGNCVYCNQDNKVTAKFILWVIDRKDGKIKKAEIGWSILKTLADLQKDAEYGFEELPPYDITIKKIISGTGSLPSDTKYSVVPARQNVELTLEETASIAKLIPIKDILDKMKGKKEIHEPPPPDDWEEGGNGGLGKEYRVTIDK